MTPTAFGLASRGEVTSPDCGIVVDAESIGVVVGSCKSEGGRVPAPFPGLRFSVLREQTLAVTAKPTLPAR
ncbi:hypothetical protein MKUB_14150 [Mycobacterium kubicae]|uniref:Uncharacterized protein n=1 Tax=Mycobacterium kubicae TaxID=120959 RepID=A0ABQ1BJU9_9MYCO|nr:hypothetical protein MKUB_14150 [Mycobacterium kubicae]